MWGEAAIHVHPTDAERLGIGKRRPRPVSSATARSRCGRRVCRTTSCPARSSCRSTTRISRSTGSFRSTQPGARPSIKSLAVRAGADRRAGAEDRAAGREGVRRERDPDRAGQGAGRSAGRSPRQHGVRLRRAHHLGARPERSAPSPRRADLPRAGRRRGGGATRAKSRRPPGRPDRSRRPVGRRCHASSFHAHQSNWSAYSCQLRHDQIA